MPAVPMTDQFLGPRTEKRYFAEEYTNSPDFVNADGVRYATVAPRPLFGIVFFFQSPLYFFISE